MTELMLGLPWLHPKWEMVLEVWDWHGAYVMTTLMTERPYGVGVYAAWLELRLHLVLLLNSMGPGGEQCSLCSDPKRPETELERHSESWSFCPGRL